MTPTATRSKAGTEGGSRSAGSGPPARSRSRGRRRLVALVIALVLGAGIVVVLVGVLGDVVREVTLPLRHDDVIRQQAADKGLDPALVAAVIYQESRFRPRTSPAGAEGLMQIRPDTARFIASRSGGTEFELRDLGSPQINISYGAWYLRYLKQRFAGDETLAVAAYNAGESRVERWVRQAGGSEEFELDRHVPFAETREYVEGVRLRRAEYREHYAEDLGL